MLFPYNKFTMTVRVFTLCFTRLVCIFNDNTFKKLIKRTIFADHLALLIERQDVLLVQLSQIATEGFSKAKEEWEKNLLLWGMYARSPSLFLLLLLIITLLFSLLFSIYRQTPGETPYRSRGSQYRHRFCWSNPTSY